MLNAGTEGEEEVDTQPTGEQGIDKVPLGVPRQ